MQIATTSAARSIPDQTPKLCLPCARRKLGAQPPKPCGDCILLNIDPLAQVRANAARPSPLLRYSASIAASFSSLCGGPSSKPARAARHGQSR